MLTDSKEYGLIGAAQLVELLSGLPEKMQRRIVRYTGARAAKIVQTAARQKAPKLTGNLSEKIIVRSSNKGGRLTMLVGLGVDKTKRKEEARKKRTSPKRKYNAPKGAPGQDNGPASKERPMKDRDPYYGRFVELGSVHNTPKPFLGPALAENAEKVLDVFTEDLKQIVDNASSGRRINAGLGRVD